MHGTEARCDLTTAASRAERDRVRLPAPRTSLSPEQVRDGVASLLRFHRGDPAGVAPPAPPDDGFVPALLHAYRDPARIRHDYPFVLRTPGRDGDERAGLPLAELLKERIASLAPLPDDARILKDNLGRLERQVRDVLGERGQPSSAAEVLGEAARVMETSLGLAAASARQLHGDLDALIASIAPEDVLVELDEHSAVRLFEHVARHRARARQTAFRTELTRLLEAVRDLQRADRARGDDGRAPGALDESFGAAGAAHIDTAALSGLLGRTRPASPPDPDREAVLDRVERSLRSWLDGPSSALITVVAGTPSPPRAGNDEITWWRAEPGGVCRAAIDRYDAAVAAHASVFGAMRAARLLAAGSWDPPRHGPLLDAFDRTGFTIDELRWLPPVLAIEDPREVVGSAMRDLSRLLRSGRTIEVILAVTPIGDPGANAGDDLHAHRFELGYLGLSHREALVHQSSAARPDHLLNGFAASLDAADAALHVVTSGLTAHGRPPRLGAWMHAGAALEGRAHPFFHYNPESGATWARRLDATANPAPEDDWPVSDLTLRADDGSDVTIPVAFTFADFALLEPAYAEHFGVIAPGLDSDQLVPLADALAREAGPNVDVVPYVWAADEQGIAHRLAVSRALTAACRDRLDWWRTLQELSGARNEHVREAVERERERLGDAFAAERAELEAAHLRAIEQARRDTARDAMGQLARALLDRDVSTLAAMTATAPTSARVVPASVADAPAPSAVTPVAPPVAEPETEPETGADAEADIAEEPWIDSALCTSCNDCLDVNPQVFIYNANKQAVIGDATAGTFAQIVQAAEKCPARCIHPGRPLDSAEPNLAELIERAKPFN